MDRLQQSAAAWEPLRTRPLVLTGSAVTVALLAIDLVTQLVPTVPARLGLPARLFDVSGEFNLPTFWNVLLLLAFAGVAGLIAGLAADRRGPAGRFPWLVVTLIGLALAGDEMLSLHERALKVPGRLLARMGISAPTYSWIIPGAVLALAGAAVTIWWARRLPRDVRRGLVLALIVYAAGAIGAEAVSGWFQSHQGVGVGYQLAAAVEEGLEWTAVFLALLAVTRMLRITQTLETRAIGLRQAETPHADRPRPARRHAAAPAQAHVPDVIDLTDHDEPRVPHSHTS
jgi:MFS family permease